ncbi:MAG: thiolase family protein [Planctomycetota bacterium]
MPLQNVFLPYGAYWSTPFCRWQGRFAGYHAIRLAAEVGASFLERRGIPAPSFEGLHLGITVHQRSSFYGAPWLAAMLGAPGITGPTVSQACATAVRLLAGAGLEIETGERRCLLAVACDRTSNGPHILYPNPEGPGGAAEFENQVLDSFNEDPHAKLSMIQTAENVARRFEISRAEQEEMTLLRYRQYEDSLAEDRAFQRRVLVPVELRRGKKVLGTVDADEGIYPTTAEGLAVLRPVLPDGTVTYGTQTHPTDGNAGMIVGTRDEARRLSADDSITIQLLSYGEARAEKGMMPMAVAPAARHALSRAGIRAADCAAIKTHNPFAVADVLFCREMDRGPAEVNHYGSPLVWGHPQAPMGMRAIIELIEELVLKGGGYGLFAGCAAGDTAMALVLKVN